MSNYEPNVSKRAFWDDMNQHANADYRTLGPYIIEAERMGTMRGDIHGYLRVWEAVGNNPHNEENAYRWVLRGSRWYDDPSEMRATAADLAGDRERIQEWCRVNAPDDEMWAKRARNAEWTNKR